MVLTERPNGHSTLDWPLKTLSSDKSKPTSLSRYDFNNSSCLCEQLIKGVRLIMNAIQWEVLGCMCVLLFWRVGFMSGVALQFTVNLRGFFSNLSDYWTLCRQVRAIYELRVKNTGYEFVGVYKGGVWGIWTLPKEVKTKRLRCVVGDLKTCLLNSFFVHITSLKKQILHNALNSLFLKPR